MRLEPPRGGGNPADPCSRPRVVVPWSSVPPVFDAPPHRRTGIQRLLLRPPQHRRLRPHCPRRGVRPVALHRLGPRLDPRKDGPTPSPKLSPKPLTKSNGSEPFRRNIHEAPRFTRQIWAAGQACQLFDEMLEEGLEPTPELYTSLLAACYRSNLLDKAFSIPEANLVHPESDNSAQLSQIDIEKVLAHLIEAELNKRLQGIKGPKYQLFLGNLKELANLNLKASAQYLPLSHDILPRVLSFYYHWRIIYGPMFLLWFGKRARFTISDPDHIKEILVFKIRVF